MSCLFFGLLFTAEWCPGCVQLNKTLPYLLKTADKTGHDIKIITIRMDNSASKFAEKYFVFSKIGLEQAQKLQNFMKVKSLPTMLIYSMKSGKLVSYDGVADLKRFRG